MNPTVFSRLKCVYDGYARNVFFLYRTKVVFRSVSCVSRIGYNDYEKEKRSFSLNLPEKFNFASDIIDVWAQKERDGKRNAAIPAFWHVSNTGEDFKLNYQNLESETKRVANMLEQCCGLKRQDNILVMLPKIPEFWLVNVASIRSGMVLSPSSMMLTPKDLSYRIAAFEPSSIIAHESVAHIVDEVAPSFPFLKSKVMVSEKRGRYKKDWLNFHDVNEKMSSNHKSADTSSDERMMIFFTSGTTGQPKMVEHTHASYGLGHMITGKYVLDLVEDSIIWNMSGDTGWAKTAYSSIFGPWLCGACVFVHQMPKFSSSITFQVLSNYPIDTFCAPPLAYRAMVQENLADQKFCKLSHCITGGEPLSAEVAKKWEANTGLRVNEAYGQTETVATIGYSKCLDFRPGSCGKPFPGMDVVVLDENENEVGPGTVGEIAIQRKGKQTFGLFKGYLGNPEKTQECMTEKYYYTGDKAYYDEDGYFWFVGRNDDLINSAGYRIGPYEVESALMEHPSVVEVAVVSSPDKKRGEVVKAFIVLSQKYSTRSEEELVKELQEHAKKVTAPYKYPRKIEFVKELPKTVSGKIKRFELKKMEWEK